MINLIRNTISSFRAMFGNAAANDFIQATGLTGATQKAAITQLCVDLQASGLWDKMKAVYPMVTDQRNLYSYTEDFTNGVWQKSGINATADTTNAPNNTLTADTLQNGTISGYVRQTNLILSAGQYTQSCYFKKNNNNWVAIYTSDGGANYAIAYFNINTGVVGTTSAIGTFSAASSSIQDAGNGWYRCSLTFTKPATGTTEVSTIVPDADNSFSRTVGQNTFAWGAQLETSTLSIYQPIATTPSAFMASQMKYNLKDARDLDAAFRLTWSGGWTYSATGATPNGTNAYADTKLNDSILTPNSSHLSFYSRTNINQAAYDIGLFNSTNGIWLGAGNNNRIKAGIFQTGASGELDQAVTNTLGFVVATKNGSTTSTAYKNGVNIISGAKPDTIATNTTIYLGALNQNGVPAYGFSTKQIGFATIGNGLSDQDNMLFNQIVEKYQVALSRGVQAAQSFYYNSAYSNEANTYLYSTQITGTTQVSAINTLINGLKANNLWTKMKAVYPFVTDKTLQADMAAQMKFNLVNPQDSDAAFRLAFSGGWTYSTNGAQPNGTNGYADTKLVPSTNLSQNNTHIASYIRNTSQGVLLGTDNAFRLWIAPNFNGINKYAEINNGATTTPTTPISTLIGLWIGSRINASTCKLYNNANVNYSYNILSSGLDTSPIYISARNAAGASNYTSSQVAFSSIGEGLSDAEVTLLNQLITEYQTALSRNV